jgi:PAT family beta-lactamase induction signal transducer AmpG
VGLTAWLEAAGWSKTAVWPVAYCVAALLIFVGLLAVLFAREPAARAALDPAADKPGALARVLRTARDAFADFLSRDAALAALAFVVLYKLCDALAGAMTAAFVLSGLGYDKASYAAIVKGLGLAALLIGGFAGGAVARALSLTTALWLGAILQMVSNLAFVWLWYQPPSAWALAVAMVLENFTGAIGTVIFVAYLSALCRSPLHTATQYALLTALAAVGRTYLSSGAGYLAELSGWPWFFVDCALAAIPSLILLAWLQRRGHFAKLAATYTRP